MAAPLRGYGSSFSGSPESRASGTHQPGFSAKRRATDKKGNLPGGPTVPFRLACLRAKKDMARNDILPEA
jgi:hypothetical protein